MQAGGGYLPADMICQFGVRTCADRTRATRLRVRLRRYFGRSPDRLGLEDVHAFQVHLVATAISWPALNQIVCALRFFYGVTLGQDTVPERIAYAREPSKLLVVLRADEVVRFLEARGATKIPTELRYRIEVRLLRRRRQIADRHVLD